MKKFRMTKQYLNLGFAIIIIGILAGMGANSLANLLRTQ